MQLKDLYARFQEELEEKKQQHDILTAHYEDEQSNFNIKMAALGMQSNCNGATFDSFLTLWTRIETAGKTRKSAGKDEEGSREAHETTGSSR